MSSRLTPQDLIEIRLRIDLGGVGRIPRPTREDLRRVFDELEECWTGNMPDWFDWDEIAVPAVDGPPHAVTMIEELADACHDNEKRFREVEAKDVADTWASIAEALHELIEDIETNEPVKAEQKEARCSGGADDNAACGGPRHPSRCARRDSGRPAPASPK